MKQVDSANAGKVEAAITGKTTDLSGAAAQLDKLLNDPLHGEVDAIRKVFGPLRDALYDADGKLKTDPRAAWGMWKNLQNAIERSKADTGNERFVQGELLDFKKAVGGALNQTSGGAFDTLNAAHAEIAKQINAQQILQKKEGTLTNRQGRINGDSFHRWLIDLAMKRGRPGIDPAMDIPDSTFRVLMNIDNDLKLNSRIDLGNPRQSATNLFFTVARAMGIGGAHAIVGAATHGSGMANVVLGHALSSAEARMGQFRLNRAVRRHLAEPEGGFQLNPLSQGASDNPFSQPPP
jgi:hypothetical protein